MKWEGKLSPYKLKRKTKQLWIKEEISGKNNKNDKVLTKYNPGNSTKMILWRKP